MRVEAEDQRPSTLLDPPPPTGSELVGGAAIAVLAHVLPPIVFAVMAVFGATGLFTDAPPAESDEAPIDNVVAARFVKLGRKLQPHQLPNRELPRLSTAPPDDIVPTKQARQREEEIPDAGPPPPNATEDLLRRLGDRAQIFAEIAEEREREGDPDGIEEGTESEAQPGDLYRGQLYMLFRRGWNVPTTIPDDEVVELSTVVQIDISQTLQVTGFRQPGSSGNPLFDQSVANRVQEVIDSGTTLPEPPEEVADEYLGQTITLRFHGRNAR